MVFEVLFADTHTGGLKSVTTSPQNIIDIQLADEKITLTEEPRNLQVEVTSHEEESSGSNQLVTSKQTSTESIYPLVTCMAQSAARVLGNVPEVQRLIESES